MTTPANTTPIQIVFHVDGWAVDQHRRWRSRVYFSRAHAIEAARVLAMREGCDVIVHGEDGEIAEVLRWNPTWTATQPSWWKRALMRLSVNTADVEDTRLTQDDRGPLPV